MQKPRLENFVGLFARLFHLNSGFLVEDYIDELEVFKMKVQEIEAYFLVDYETGNELYNSIDGTPTEFIWLGSEKKRYGLYNEGFYIIDSETREILFRSNDFLQTVKLKKQSLFTKLLNKNQQNAEKQYRVIFQDMKTRNKYISSAPIKSGMEQFPKRLLVKRRNLTDKDYEYILNSLSVVCKAAVEIGNPVVWC